MRIAAFILFSVLSTLASANGLPSSGAAAAEGTGNQTTTAPVNQIGAAMAGDALQCDRSVVIENPETAKAITERAVSDADEFANRLAELPGAAQASVTALAAGHTLDQPLLNRAFFAKMCERLAEKGIAPAELKPALQNLAQALGLAYPDQAVTGGETAAPAQAETDKASKASPAAAPGAESGLQIPRLSTDEPQVQAEAKTPAEMAAEPSAPLAVPSEAPAVPTAPPSPAPATEAERAAPVPGSAPALPQAPAAESVPSQSAQTPIAAPPDAAPPPSAPSAPGRAAPEAAPEPAAERAMTPSAPEAPAAPAPPPAQVAEAPAPSAPEAAPSAPPDAAAPAAAVDPAAPPAQIAEAPAPPAPEAAPSAPPDAAAPAAPVAAAPPPAQVAEAPAPSAPETAPSTSPEPAAPEVPAAPAPPSAQIAEAPAPSASEAAPSTSPEPAVPAAPIAPAPPPAQVAEAPAPSAPEAAPSTPPEAAASEIPAAPAPPPAQVAEAPAQPPMVTPAPEPAAKPVGTEPEKPRAKRPEGAVDKLGDEECRTLGVLDSCPDLNAVLDRLLERPLEYNYPGAMLLGRKTEITLVLRTDWEGKDLPTEVSEELKGLPGEVKQAFSKITRVMSAELTGREFDISPASRQERTVVPPQPVSWSWQVSPTDTGEKKPLKLRLYAHLQHGGGTMPPILVKTLDASINVDVTTWDWVVIQARTLEPIYAIGAALLGLLTAILTYLLTRRGEPVSQGGYREATGTRDSGPVIGDLGQSATDRRAATPSSRPDASAAPAGGPPIAPTKPEPPDGGGLA